MAISPFDLFEGHDFGTAVFLLLKVAITEPARLNRKSIDDIAAFDWILSYTIFELRKLVSRNSKNTRR